MLPARRAGPTGWTWYRTGPMESRYNYIYYIRIRCCSCMQSSNSNSKRPRSGTTSFRSVVEYNTKCSSCLLAYS